MIHVQILFRRMGMRVMPWGKRGFFLRVVAGRAPTLPRGVMGGFFSVAVPVGA